MKIETRGLINNETCRLFEECLDQDGKLNSLYAERMKEKFISVDDILSFKGKGMLINSRQSLKIQEARRSYNEGVLDTLNKLNKEIRGVVKDES